MIPSKDFEKIWERLNTLVVAFGHFWHPKSVFRRVKFPRLDFSCVIYLESRAAAIEMLGVIRDIISRFCCSSKEELIYQTVSNGNQGRCFLPVIYSRCESMKIHICKRWWSVGSCLTCCCVGSGLKNSYMFIVDWLVHSFGYQGFRQATGYCIFWCPLISFGFSVGLVSSESTGICFKFRGGTFWLGRQ